MYAYLKGTLVEATFQKITLDVGGVGYELFISLSCFEKLPSIGSEIKMFTSLIIREDSHKLFGFLSSEEKDCFHTLCDVSGIGPRLAVSILGHLSLTDLYSAVSNQNSLILSAVPGIGKKMAERIILELKDRIQKKSLSSTPKALSSQTVVLDAISALIHLGYQPKEAQKTVQDVMKNISSEPPLSELISLSLKTKKG